MSRRARRQACVVAIDVGTQSARAALVDRDGRILDGESAPLRLFTPRPGWSEQSPAEWWRQAAGTVAALLARHPGAGVEAVGVGAQMHGAVPLDRAGEPLLDRVATWNDKRSAPIAARCDPALAAIAGNAPLPAWAGLKMAWLREAAPDVYARSAGLLVVKDFLNLRLTGVWATDPTEASGSFLVDHRTGAWSDELVAALGLRAGTLPEIRASADVIGGVSAEAAAATGLARGTPVVCGAGDMLCQLLAAGVTAPGRVAEVSGTASIVAAWAGEPAADERLMSLRTACPDGWVRFGIVDAGGVSLRWFAERVCAAEAQDELFPLAEAAPPGAAGLRFLPYLLGERTMGPATSRASFAGLTPGHGRPEMARALLEGICLELRRALTPIRAGLGATELRVTGGGARSALWNRIRAAVYGLPVRPLAVVEGGVLGAAMLAGVGAGWWPDAAAAVDGLVGLGAPVQPDPAWTRVYDAAFAEFEALHAALEPFWRQTRQERGRDADDV